MNHDYLEQYAWKILGARYIHEPRPLSERIDVEASIQHSLEEREALYMRINGIKPVLANYWQLPVSQRAQIRQSIGK